MFKKLGLSIIIVIILVTYVIQYRQLTKQQDKIIFLRADLNTYSKLALNYIDDYEKKVKDITPELYLNAKKEATSDQKIGFCIVTASYNNFAYARQNLGSLLIQNYHNWRLIYLDDNSSDGTDEIVSQIKKESNLSDEKFKIIRNQRRIKSPLANIYFAAHNFCKDEEVMVILDGDDMLANPNVLSQVANIYQDGKIWLTHGQFIGSDSGSIGNCCNREISHKDWPKLRKMSWAFSHLRSSYTWLFKKIKKEDLQYKGEFFTATADYATMFPQVEMAGKDRVKFIRDVTYIYRSHSGSESITSSTEQNFFANYIVNLPKYDQLESGYIFKK